MEPGLPSMKLTSNFLLALSYEFWGTAFAVCAFNFGDFGADQNIARAFSYLIAWYFAVTISGAHFNPAISLAVFIHERKARDHIKFFIAVIIVQMVGAYVGILITYLVLGK